MTIHIRPASNWPPERAELARKRLQFALGRFASRVRSLTVRLSDLNGPRGGVDKRCLIALRLERPARVIVVEDVDRDYTIAINRAAARASRAVVDAVGRRRAQGSVRPPKPTGSPLRETGTDK